MLNKHLAMVARYVIENAIELVLFVSWSGTERFRVTRFTVTEVDVLSGALSHYVSRK